MGMQMSDALRTLTAELERLVRQILTETDPTRYDELAAQIWRVLDERERLQNPKSLDEDNK
jgi:hypothetical protein